MHASLPMAYRLYLPKEWVDDEAPCHRAGVPDDVGFKTKPEIALEQVRWACEGDLSRGAVLMDAGYGASTDLRTDITALGLTYVAGAQHHRAEKGRRAIATAHHQARRHSLALPVLWSENKVMFTLYF